LVDTARRHLQHVVNRDWRESSASGEIGANDAGDVQRGAGTAIFPTEWHNGNRCPPARSLGNFDLKFR
jgi:hypothetical protein